MLSFPLSSVSKESACNSGDLGLIPGSGRSPENGNGNPLQYSCLENPMDSSTPDSFVLGIFQARILEWVAISISRGSSWPKDQTRVSRVSCLGRQILYHCATWEAYNSLYTRFKFSSRIPSLLSKFSNLFKYFKNLPNTSLGLPPKWNCVELWLLVCSYDLFH